MDTIPAVVRAGRERDGVAIDGPSRPAPYRYRDFCTDVWKAGNLYSHYGSQRGGTVAVVPRDHPTTDGPPPASAMALLAVLGGAVVGSTVKIPTANPVAAGVILAHVESLGAVAVDGQSTVLAYGGDTDRAAVERFESGLWSENPVEPPESVAAEDDCLATDGDIATHGQSVRAAAAVAGEYGVDQNATVVLDAPLTDAGAVVAGIVMPLVVGASIQLSSDSGTADTAGDFLVGSEPAADSPGQPIPSEEARRLLRDA